MLSRCVAVAILGGGIVAMASEARAVTAGAGSGEQYACSELDGSYSTDGWQFGAFQLCGRAEFGSVNWLLRIRDLHYLWGSYWYQNNTEAHVKVTVRLSKDCSEINSEILTVRSTNDGAIVWGEYPSARASYPVEPWGLPPGRYAITADVTVSGMWWSDTRSSDVVSKQRHYNFVIPR